MPRSIWTGTISFGLVTIPVTLHPAVRDRGPHFHLLHAKDRSRIKNQRVCEREGKAVEWKDVVRGFEYRKGHYVVVTDEDFERAALERSKTVDVLAFVDRGEIDERFFENSYFLVPEKSGERAYALLREAIRKTRRLGIGKFVLREAQHLVALHVVGDAIVLTVMHFSEDLVPISGHDFPATSGLRAKDVELAESLIERLSERWRPEKYVDEYRGNLRRVIEAKVKSREPKLEVEEPRRGGEVVDLMERLRASLEGRERKRRPAAAGRKRERRRRAARRVA